MILLKLSGMKSLTEEPRGCERWCIRRKPPSPFGTRPKGELMNGKSDEVERILPSCKSSSSFTLIIEGSRIEDLRFFERTSCRGP